MAPPPSTSSSSSSMLRLLLSSSSLLLLVLVQQAHGFVTRSPTTSVPTTTSSSRRTSSSRQEHRFILPTRGANSLSPSSLPSTASASAGGEDVEIHWFEAFQQYGRSRPYDPLLKNLEQVSSWKQFQTKIENDWVTARVESDGDRTRLNYKLEGYLEALQEYLYVHTLFVQVLDPAANGCDGMFMERVRMDAYQSAQRVVREKQEDYFAAHVRFWADLAAVLKSQEDIPLGDVPKLDQCSPLPAPYGQAENALVLLPLPSLIEWKRDELGGGVEDQVGALMLFKSVILPALETFKKDRTKANLLNYASFFGRIWRKAGRWFGNDMESKEFLEDLFEKARGRVGTNDDPTSTGISLPGVLQVSSRGMEDAWVE